MLGGRRMMGGIAASVHRLSVRTSADAVIQVVLKRFNNPLWDDDWAGIVRNEAAALAGVEASGVPAPELLGSCADGSDTDGVPSLLMARAPGRVWLTASDLDAWVAQMAAVLPRIHQARADVPSHRSDILEHFALASSTRRPDLWAEARRVLAEGPPPSEATFVHGDFQHFNLLWSRGRLSSVIDWSFARVGSPDIDVGHCRLNLGVLFSAELAERFRLAYEAEAGRGVDPWWDIHELLAYGSSWGEFIPLQVAGRRPVDTRGMTARVEELLAGALDRL